MHSAPAVNYPVGRSCFQGWLLGLTGLVGLVAGFLWQAQVDLVGWRQWLFALTLLGACLMAVRAWWRAPVGRLYWDGHSWRWTGADASVSGSVTVHLDLQFCLVLSLHTDAGARFWLWAERRAEVALWRALRRAVFARRVADATRDASADADWAHR